MEAIFGTLLQKAIETSSLDRDVEQARVWLRDKATSIRSMDASKVISRSNQRAASKVIIGQMFLFAYDPEHKTTLPYYDRYPLIFPIKMQRDGFIGVNMHYLPLPLRAKLMDALYNTLNNDKLDNTSRLRISYNILSSTSKFRYFKPCIKRYLNSNIDSKLIYIDPKEWDAALFLPLQKFQKAQASTVYRDSRRIINKG